ncbi:hypothetical protein VNO77_03951 [Canavalia gladiata]|uniref:Uncharacterized protein n=1 Tax=Canavalia gladiata TaxID=3824 RepID=A0AAN9RCQ2_CANGL
MHFAGLELFEHDLRWRGYAFGKKVSPGLRRRENLQDSGEGSTLILPREESDSAGEHSIEDSDNPLDYSSRLYPRLSCFFKIVMRMPLPCKETHLNRPLIFNLYFRTTWLYGVNSHTNCRAYALYTDPELLTLPSLSMTSPCSP